MSAFEGAMFMYRGAFSWVVQCVGVMFLSAAVLSKL